MAEFSAFPALPPPVDVRLTITPEHPCVYLPGRVAQMRAFWAQRISPSIYHELMDAGFRRSGRVVYQPVCNGCRACQPIRVLVDAFSPSKSQRRCWRKNQDLVVSEDTPKATDEKFELYSRYLRDWHGRSEPDDRATFESFLYDSPVQTLEHSYRDAAGRLLAVGICDVSRDSLSSVYFYFDPAHSHRGLGTFGALHEIGQARNMGIPYYYLGYWVSQCQAMRYKADLRPAEVLQGDGVWRALI
jgi:arginine-tRNA-protein transferase